MNKLSKIFLVIIIILIVALCIMTYLYFDMKENAQTMRDSYVSISTDLINLKGDYEADAEIQNNEHFINAIDFILDHLVLNNVR